MNRSSVGHHDNTIDRVGACIAATENRWTLPLIDQPPRDRGDNRRLARAAHRQIADADDGTRQVTPSLRLALHAPAPHAHHLPVNGIKQGV